MREGRFRPALEDDRYRLLERLAVTLLVLDRRAIWPTQCLVLTRLVAAAHAAFDASAADYVELCNLLGDAHRVMPDDDIGALTQPDSFGLCGNRHLGEKWVRTHLRAFRLKMVLGEPERLEPQLLCKDALADLAHQDFLRGGMYLREGAIVHRDPLFGHDHRKARCAIVEYTDL